MNWPLLDLSASPQVKMSILASHHFARNKSREGKILNLFTIVRFKNSACNGTTTTQAGICYPYANCLLKSGTTDGSCALGEAEERLILPHLVQQVLDILQESCYLLSQRFSACFF